MSVFVDESGDLGVSKESTRFFVVVYSECKTPQKIQAVLKRLLKQLHQKKENQEPETNSNSPNSLSIED